MSMCKESGRIVSIDCAIDREEMGVGWWDWVGGLVQVKTVTVGGN